MIQNAFHKCVRTVYENMNQSLIKHVFCNENKCFLRSLFCFAQMHLIFLSEFNDMFAEMNIQ